MCRVGHQRGINTRQREVLLWCVVAHSRVHRVSTETSYLTVRDLRLIDIALGGAPNAIERRGGGTTKTKRRGLAGARIVTVSISGWEPSG